MQLKAHQLLYFCTNIDKSVNCASFLFLSENELQLEGEFGESKGQGIEIVISECLKT